MRTKLILSGSVLHKLACALAISAVTFGQLAPVQAADPQQSVQLKDLKGEAKKSLDLGATLYKNNDKKAAKAAFWDAYEKSKNPRVLYNIAICERELQRYPQASEVFARELVEGASILTLVERQELETFIEQLKAVISFVKLDVSEPGATISIIKDKAEEEIGKSPMREKVAVAVGTYPIIIRKAGFEPVTISAALKSQETFEKAVKLESVLRSTSIEVTVEGPPSALILIDGIEQGQTPYRGYVSVVAEPHSIEARAEGYVPGKQTVIAKEGEKIAIRMSLASRSETGRGVLDAPSDAEIIVDGKSFGKSHWEGPLAAGHHQVIAKKEGFYTRSQDLEIEAGKTKTLTLTLDENRNTAWVGWAIGSVLVIGGSIAAGYAIFLSKPPDIPGSLRSKELIAVPAAFRFR
jgi:PEGA domain